MAKVIKILFYTFATIFAIWALLVIILSQVGIETKRFNSLIIEQVKKYNEDLNLDIKKVKIYLNISDLTNPRIKIRSNEPTLILGKNKIELESIRTEIDILSYFKNNFIIDKFVVVTKDNKIKDLISIASLEKPSLIIYNIFVQHAEFLASLFIIPAISNPSGVNFIATNWSSMKNGGYREIILGSAFVSFIGVVLYAFYPLLSQ